MTTILEDSKGTKAMKKPLLRCTKKHIRVKNTRKDADFYGVLDKWLEIRPSSLGSSEAGNGLFTLIDLDKGIFRVNT